ncbi:trehalose-phosphatase [Massilia forsythiae]|uniref:Trehalose 6-phosphate phosphatase n=1 Tax=Massilia forsythiae TaxID=2728020 RepID=A0A7Z2VTL3_9BURK|nr:trehalose-phosphatase [Massilia forsythiae]QJD98877.1 trehalose-phosphatase [Massilia forsythiae]
MIGLLSPAGRAALAGLLRADPLLGFDFDGTLAPIRPRPDQVWMDARPAAAFAELARRLPVAVVTGRGVADVRPRLAGTPRWVIGNHGAEGMPGADPARLAAQAAVCAGWHAQLGGVSTALGDGVVLEDKRYTLCLHYRQTPDHEAARRALAARIAALQPAPEVVGGKCVFNLLPAGSVDKFGALRELARRMGTENVFFIGDDENDELVFRRAPPSWVTVKVGADGPSAARFGVPDQASVADCLELLLALSGEGLRDEPTTRLMPFA